MSKNISKKKVVCFGGGTGMPSLLSGLKKNPWLEITAVVNMFDTGGSSGELKDQFGILPPGDVLKSLLALSENESFARRLLQKRIQNPKSTIHTGGNILLLGLEKVFNDYISAIDGLGQLLNIHGRVLPVTTESSTLQAVFTNRATHNGETSIDIGVYEGFTVEELKLNPQVPAYPEVIYAIEQADCICIGPGSFYTSVLPNFLPSGVKEALSVTNCKVIFICNLLTEGWGMKDSNVQHITQTVEEYIGRNVDSVITNSTVQTREVLDNYSNERKAPIQISCDESFASKLILADLWTNPNIARHDEDRLGYLVSSMILNI